VSLHGYELFENTDAITLHSLGVHFSLVDANIDVEFEEITGDTNLKSSSGPLWLPVTLVCLEIIGRPSVPSLYSVVYYQ